MSSEDEFDDEEKGVEQEEEDDDEEDKWAKAMIPYLSNRAYHIPGHSWVQDWYQNVIANNHPVFGLCLAYKYHPVTMVERILVLLSSLAASLVISEGFYLIWLLKEDGYVSKNSDADISSSYQGYKIAVYTIGAVIHTAFDLFIWAVAGCSCAEHGGKVYKLNKKTKTSPLVVFGIFCVTTTFAILLSLMYETIDNGSTGEDKEADANYTLAILEEGFSAIDFDIALSGVGTVEENDKWLSWFTHYLIYIFGYDLAFATIFFSGILGYCTKKVPLVGPLLGGRPLEMTLEKEAGEKKKRKKKKKKKSKRRVSTESETESIESSVESIV
mmetsp:Transcript_3395/g.5588  ORF Transcript_3395/g.5588 Transcript_3395/m.5588 type:complete len:328 (+) Transcript_3395:168-1151(+)|eukprot:CAMPEP_0119018946 /NCGR_PEP_ID=MMETSP1176-20130426/20658_1 /TAXON_ID=265551 /ORGANISM="Synedropsis recta cf, Strain CCMP1620" /LENGTH=327 /DNA_ID=CAMNT_0006973059 /DNA_START=153 /DNA_END=1136 /DNA_ORIENTATION=-